MKRSEAREIVFKIIFQREFHDDFENIYARLLDEAELRGVQREYAEATIKGILDNSDVIDGIISSDLKDTWTMDRLPKAVKAVLRLGTYEILFNDEIPDVSAIDEAVKLAFAYCDAKDATFINGLLHKIYETKNNGKTSNA